jgi:hypothetical protein
MERRVLPPLVLPDRSVVERYVLLLKEMNYGHLPVSTRQTQQLRVITGATKCMWLVINVETNKIVTRIWGTPKQLWETLRIQWEYLYRNVSIENIPFHVWLTELKFQVE